MKYTRNNLKGLEFITSWSNPPDKFKLGITKDDRIETIPISNEKNKTLYDIHYNLLDRALELLDNKDWIVTSSPILHSTYGRLKQLFI